MRPEVVVAAVTSTPLDVAAHLAAVSHASAGAMATFVGQVRDHDPDAVRHLVALAASLDVVVTGSSDYHGDGKQNRLGERTTTPEVLERIEALATGTEVVRP